jgi:CheY-like chemotaxis protein
MFQMTGGQIPAPVSPISIKERFMIHAVPLILLVARQAATLALWEELLGHSGYATIACQTTRATQQCIEINHPDLLLLECDLEWYGAGWDLLYVIRQRPATAQLPVIMYATDRHWLRVQHRELQTQECQILGQPFCAAELCTAIATALTSASLHERAVGIEPAHGVEHRP